MFYRRKGLVFAQFSIFLVNFGSTLHSFAFSCIILLKFAVNFAKRKKAGNTQNDRKNSPKNGQKWSNLKGIQKGHKFAQKGLKKTPKWAQKDTKTTPKRAQNDANRIFTDIIFFELEIFEVIPNEFKWCQKN